MSRCGPLPPAKSAGITQAALEIAHELIQPLLVLRLTQAGQVGVESRHRRTLVAQIDLDLPEVLPLFQEMCGVRMSVMPSSA